MARYNNILIIQPAFIGDAILASCLIEKLHAFFPSASVSILVRKGNETVYLGHPFLQEVLVWDKNENKMLNLFRILLRIRRNRYDCVVNCHRYASSGFLTGFSGAKHTTGYKQNPFSFLFNTTVKHVIGDGRHETARYHQLVEDFTDSGIHNPRLYPSAGDLEVVRPLQTAHYTCMAPASVWFTKQLPPAKWIELLNAQSPATTVYLLGAPGDLSLCETIKQGSSHHDIKILAGKLSLLQSCALMESAIMNYVNDSAPLHLASAINAPVTAFFTSTVPEFGFGPLSRRSKTLGVSGLSCRPCGLHGYKACPLDHFKCGHLMPIEEVMNNEPGAI